MWTKTQNYVQRELLHKRKNRKLEPVLQLIVKTVNAGNLSCLSIKNFHVVNYHFFLFFFLYLLTNENYNKALKRFT